MSSRKSTVTTLTFEQTSDRLDRIVALMEQPETGLEEMISLVEEGLGLIRRSRALLTEAELRIRKLEEAPEDTPAGHKAQTTPQQDDGFSLL